jgi:hypothetical protein
MVRDRDTPINEITFDAHLLEDPDDVATARALVLQAVLGGCRTTGDLLGLVSNASAAEQRLIFDDAREAAGLERSEDIDAHAQFVQANQAARRRAADRPVPVCAVCGVRPTGAGGVPAEVPPARRWHCPDHEHLAEPGDLDPPAVPFDFATMSIIDPDEDERARREDELLKREHERRLRERRELAEVLRQAGERYAAAHRDDPYHNPWAGAGWRPQ